jgi:hypothetical protein
LSSLSASPAEHPMIALLHSAALTKSIERILSITKTSTLIDKDA